MQFSDDKLLSLESLFSRFDGGEDHLQSFVGLPKIFILDLCRGSKISDPVQRDVNCNTYNGKLNGIGFRNANALDEKDKLKLFHHRDNAFIKVFSITKGNAAPDSGYLVEYLCKMMKQTDLKKNCFHKLVKMTDLEIRKSSAMHCIEFVSTACFETYFQSDC